MIIINVIRWVLAIIVAIAFIIPAFLLSTFLLLCAIFSLAIFFLLDWIGLELINDFDTWWECLGKCVGFPVKIYKIMVRAIAPSRARK